MKNSKRLFLIFAILFFGAMGYLGYDISSRTNFPGSKSQLQERLIEEYRDSSQVDSLKNLMIKGE